MSMPEGEHPAGERSAAKKQLLTEPELKSMVSDSLTTLAGELAQGKSEHLLTYLDFASRFHHYSRANQWLILMQNPDATRVASYKKWQRAGYQAAHGPTRISILPPPV